MKCRLCGAEIYNPKTKECPSCGASIEWGDTRNDTKKRLTGE